MPSDALTITIPQAELNDLSRIIQLRAGYLRESMRDSTLWAAWFIARAAGAACRVAPKTRRVIANPNRGKGLPGKHHTGGRNWWPFVAIRKFREPQEVGYGHIPIGDNYPNAKTARQMSPQARIRDYQRGKVGGRGLLRASWAWAVGVARRASNSRLTESGKRGSHTIFTIEQGVDPVNPAVTMTNRLRYAAFGFKSNGKATVDNIISRGTNSMRKDLEKRAGVAIARAG